MRSRNALVVIVTNCKDKILAHYEATKKKEEKAGSPLVKNKEVRKKKKEDEINESFEESDTKSVYSEDKVSSEFIFMQVPKMGHYSNVLSLIPMQILV